MEHPRGPHKQIASENARGIVSSLTALASGRGRSGGTGMDNDSPGAAAPKTGRALVIVDPIHSGFRLAKTAAKLGFEIIPLFTVPKHLVPEDVLAHFHIKTYNFEKDPARAQRIIETERRRRFPDAPPLIAAVLPGAEPGVELAFALAELLGLPGNRPTLPGAFRDKGTMRTALKLAGLPYPKFAVCADRDAAVHFARSAAFPLVVKAPASAGADKVFKCRDMAELEQRVAHVLETPSVFGDFARYALVEEFIRGEEYVVDLLGSATVRSQ
jgi:biotin carboxylase